MNLRVPFEAALGYVKENPDEVVRAVINATGLRFGIPLAALRWAVLQAKPGKRSAGDFAAAALATCRATRAFCQIRRRADDRPRRISHRHRLRRNVGPDHRSRSDHGARSDAHAFEHDRIHPNPDVVFELDGGHAARAAPMVGINSMKIGIDDSDAGSNQAVGPQRNPLHCDQFHAVGQPRSISDPNLGTRQARCKKDWRTRTSGLGIT